MQQDNSGRVRKWVRRANALDARAILPWPYLLDLNCACAVSHLTLSSSPESPVSALICECSTADTPVSHLTLSSSPESHASMRGVAPSLERPALSAF